MGSNSNSTVHDINRLKKLRLSVTKKINVKNKGIYFMKYSVTENIILWLLEWGKNRRIEGARYEKD